VRFQIELAADRRTVFDKRQQFAFSGAYHQIAGWVDFKDNALWATIVAATMDRGFRIESATTSSGSPRSLLSSDSVACLFLCQSPLAHVTAAYGRQARFGQ
jgi:hypothetical protein